MVVQNMKVLLYIACVSILIFISFANKIALDHHYKFHLIIFSATDMLTNVVNESKKVVLIIVIRRHLDGIFILPKQRNSLT